MSEGPDDSGLSLGSVTPGWAVVAAGLVTTAIAVWNFLRELSTLSVSLPPAVAAALTIGGSLAVVAAGLWVLRIDFTPQEELLAAGWSLGLMALLASTLAVTMVIRTAEGRVIGEPVFPLVVVANIGAIAGLFLGTLQVRSRRETDRAEQARDSMAFLNSLLRHDVLNALQVIRGHAETVQASADLEDETARESVASIREQLHSLTDLVEELRVLSEVYAGEEELEPVDVESVLADTVRTATKAHPDADVRTAVETDLWVEATGAISSVFDNLVGNAVLHNDTPAPVVEIRAEREADSVRVTVADDGPGVPQDEREQVFDRDTGDNHGLGLYIVRTLVEEYGGTVQIEASDLGGAAFVVTLPAIDPPAESAATERGDDVEPGDAQSQEPDTDAEVEAGAIGDAFES